MRALAELLLLIACAGCVSSPVGDQAEWRAWADGVSGGRGGESGPRRGDRGLPSAVGVPDASSSHGADAALAGRLSRERVPAFVVEGEESLRRVAGTLATMTGLPIVTHPSAEVAALDAGAVFDLSLSNPIQVRDLLDLLVEAAGGDVAWVVRHGAIVITTRENAREGRLVLVHHDINMLVMGRTDFVAPRLDRLRLLDDLEDEDGNSVFGDEGERVSTMEEGDVATLVQEAIAPDTWDEDGVAISAENGFLLVRHTPAVQARIRAFLVALGA